MESLGSGLRDQTMEQLLVVLQLGADNGDEPIVHLGREFIFKLGFRSGRARRGEGIRVVFLLRWSRHARKARTYRLVHCPRQLGQTWLSSFLRPLSLIRDACGCELSGRG
jgi:hypothetical protein